MPAPYTLPSVMHSTDGLGYDGPVPLNHAGFKHLRDLVLRSGKDSQDFVVPYELRNTWGFRLGDSNYIYYPTAIRVRADSPKTVWIQYRTLRKHQAATMWSPLERKGSSWKGKLPLGSRGGLANVKLGNGYFPRVAIETERAIKPDRVGSIIGYTIERSAWSGPGRGVPYIAAVGRPTKAKVTQSLDGSRIYWVHHWLDAGGEKYREGSTAESFEKCDVRYDGESPFVGKPSALVTVNEAYILPYLV